MSSSTKIEWTDHTWNPVTGCSMASEGCRFCYAVKMTKRLEAMGNDKYKGLVNIGKDHFNGVVKCHEDALLIPLGWRKPRRVFVNSMSDLFHKDVPVEFIAKVFAVMALNWVTTDDGREHTFQVLTKRPDNAARILNDTEFLNWVTHLMKEIHYASGGKGLAGENSAPTWPLPNVWIGTSVEDHRVINRVDYLRLVPAAVRFLSIEPLIGPMHDIDLTGIHWVIAGGESGKNARPMDVVWLYRLKEQCEAADVPIFIKQLGKSFYHSGYRDGEDIITAGPKGADWDHINFPDDLKVREFPEVDRG